MIEPEYGYSEQRDEEEISEDYFADAARVFNSLEAIDIYSGAPDAEYYANISELLHAKAAAVMYAAEFMQQELNEAAQACIAAAELINRNNGLMTTSGEYYD